MDYEVFISERVSQLRLAKNVSARQISLDIGQNANYINDIENRKTTPSISGLIYICDYFGITPHEFFDEGNKQPANLKEFIEDVKLLDAEALNYLSKFVKEVVSKK